MDLPQPFGAYLLERSLARGGMAEVFIARTDRPGFRKRICIKRVVVGASGGRDFAAMFRDEAALAAKLHHPNIVEVFDFGEVDGALYLAMEYVEGLTLGALLAKHVINKVPLDLAAAVQIAVGVCRGLQHAHTLADESGRPLGVVHRDVSPQNVLLSLEGEVKVADFGVARAEDRLVRTLTGITKGKAAYMAPEQALAETVDHRTDQFATGIVLWEMLACRRLFRSRTDMEAMKKVVKAEVAPPSSVRAEIPPALDAVALRALSLSPADRFADMAALEAALLETLFDVATSPRDLDLRPIVKRALDDTFHTDEPSVRTLTDTPRWVDEANTESQPRVEERTEPAIPALEDDVQGEPTVPMPPAPGDHLDVRELPEPERPRRPVAMSRGAWLSLSAGGALVVVLGVAGGVISASRDSEPPLAAGVMAKPAAPPPRDTSVAVEPMAPADDTEPEVPAEAPPVVAVTPPIDEPAAADDEAAEDDAQDDRPTGAGSRRAAPRRSAGRTAAPRPAAAAVDETGARVHELERLGTQALLTGNAALAARYLQEATNLDPRRASLFRGLGQANDKLGKKREAAAAYRVYLALSPSAPDRSLVAQKIEELGR